MIQGKTGLAAEWLTTGLRLLSKTKSLDVDNTLEYRIRKEKLVAELKVKFKTRVETSQIPIFF